MTGEIRDALAFTPTGDGRTTVPLELPPRGSIFVAVWPAPWRVELTAAVHATGNKLEIDVVNLWPNRLIGEAALPPEKRLTKPNVTKFKPTSPLLPSGLLGPVTVQAGENTAPSGPPGCRACIRQ